MGWRGCSRRTFTALAQILVERTTTKLDAPAIGHRFRFDQGDGDQRFLGVPKPLRLVDADWFPGTIPGFGEAMLFVIEDGEFAGEYVAITTRVQGSLVAQFVKSGTASAVVHRVRNPTASYEETRDEFDPSGMAPVYWIRE